jgi:hypothetical protein
MTKDEYWQAHVRKHPKFLDPDAEIKIKVGMLHRLLDDAYEKGSEHNPLEDLLDLLLCLYRYSPQIRM